MLGYAMEYLCARWNCPEMDWPGLDTLFAVRPTTLFMLVRADEASVRKLEQENLDMCTSTYCFTRQQHRQTRRRFQKERAMLLLVSAYIYLLPIMYQYRIFVKAIHPETE
jgi:hypothetical protein